MIIRIPMTRPSRSCILKLWDHEPARYMISILIIWLNTGAKYTVFENTAVTTM